MKNIQQLITHNRLNVIDAIVLRKRFIGMVDHYVLYAGKNDQNQPIFLANYKNGVQFVPQNDMIQYLNVLDPERIVRFNGNDYERNLAINRAKSRIGEKAYDYLSNNCEHFVTWVHSGKHNSKQVLNAGESLMAVGAVTAVAGAVSSIGNKKNNKNNNLAIGVGIGAVLLGALLKYGFNDTEE